MENETYTQEELMEAMNKVFKTPEERRQIHIMKESMIGNIIDPFIIQERNRKIDLWIINRAKEIVDIEV